MKYSLTILGSDFTKSGNKIVPGNTWLSEPLFFFPPHAHPRSSFLPSFFPSFLLSFLLSFFRSSFGSPPLSSFSLLVFFFFFFSILCNNSKSFGKRKETMKATLLVCVLFVLIAGVSASSHSEGFFSPLSTKNPL